MIPRPQLSAALDGQRGGRAVLNALSCPHCGGAAPRGLFWRCPFLWSEWSCPSCRAVVGYNRVRRSLGAAVLTVLCLTLPATLRPLASIPLTFALGCLVIWMFDSAELRKVPGAASIRDSLSSCPGEDHAS
jgi:O-antigen ligase